MNIIADGRFVTRLLSTTRQSSSGVGYRHNITRYIPRMVYVINYNNNNKIRRSLSDSYKKSSEWPAGCIIKAGSIDLDTSWFLNF